MSPSETPDEKSPDENYGNDDEPRQAGVAPVLGMGGAQPMPVLTRPVEQEEASADPLPAEEDENVVTPIKLNEDGSAS